MTRQKGKFLTFCFSLVPGAGHMYLGFMKQGISLMTLFALLCAVAVWLQTGALILFAPIIWFYSFFDVINKNSLDEAEFYALEDHYIWGENWNGVWEIPQGHKRRVLAAGLLVIAGLMIWSVLSFLANWLPDQVWILRILIDQIPVLAAAGGIIWIALRLMRSVKEEDDSAFFEDETASSSPYPIVPPPALDADTHAYAEKKVNLTKEAEEIKQEEQTGEV